MTKIPRLTSAPVAVLLLLILVITTVSGVTGLFTHYFPAIPPSSTMTTTCSNQSPPYPSLVSDPTTVAERSSGQVSFRCSDTNPAFTISGGVFSAFPYFAPWFAAPYTTLWIYQSDGTTTTGPCTDRTAARQLEDRVTEVDVAPNNYNYCAEYVDVGSGGLASFYVYWYNNPSFTVLLFAHTAPAVPTPATMTSTCANALLIASPSTVDPGSTGQISFQCSDTNPAFTISGGTFSAIPYFDGSGFAAPYTTLWIYQSDGGATTGDCSARTVARQLTSGVAAADIAPFNYNYCAEYANVGGGGLPAFYVSWTTT